MYYLRSIFLAFTMIASLAAQAAQSAGGSGGLTIEELVKMTRSGFSEEVIITKIKKNGKPFDLTTDELLDLKKGGVTDNILKYLLDPSQPYTARPTPASSGSSAGDPLKPITPAKVYPADDLALNVPPEPGLYFFDANGPVKMAIKVLLSSNAGAGLGKVLMKKGKTSAYLVGPVARTRFTSAPSFYMRLTEGKGIEDVVLVAFERKDNRREIEMGPPGPKQQLKAEVMRQFDSLEVGLNLFKLTPTSIGKGEYLFFLIGSAEPPKGSQGKGYDFAIDERNRLRKN